MFNTQLMHVQVIRIVGTICFCFTIKVLAQANNPINFRPRPGSPNTRPAGRKILASQFYAVLKPT